MSTSRGLPLNAMDEIHCCGMALRMSPTSKRDKERRGRFSLKADANIIQSQEYRWKLWNSINEGLYTKSLIVRI